MSKVIFKINETNGEEKGQICEMLREQDDKGILVVDERIKVIVVTDNEVTVID